MLNAVEARVKAKTIQEENQNKMEENQNKYVEAQKLKVIEDFPDIIKDIEKHINDKASQGEMSTFVNFDYKNKVYENFLYEMIGKNLSFLKYKVKKMMRGSEFSKGYQVLKISW